MKKLIVICLVLGLLLASCSEGGVAPQPQSSTTVISSAALLSSSSIALASEKPDRSRAIAFAQKIHPGISLNGQGETEWGLPRSNKKNLLDSIVDWGFRSVRFALRIDGNYESAENSCFLKEEMESEIQNWAEGAIEKNLIPLFSIHSWKELFADPKSKADCLVDLWRDIAQALQPYGGNLGLELLNEPGGEMSPFDWNEILVKLIPGIRQKNVEATLLIQAGTWANAADLEYLKVPSREWNWIGVFHLYKPLGFTHWGANWVDLEWETPRWTATQSQKSEIAQEFELAAEWREKTGVPILLGEFGSYKEAELRFRYLWTSFVTELAQEQNLPWIYWELTEGFGFYDALNLTTNDSLKEALLDPRIDFENYTFVELKPRLGDLKEWVIESFDRLPDQRLIQTQYNAQYCLNHDMDLARGKGTWFLFKNAESEVRANQEAVPTDTMASLISEQEALIRAYSKLKGTGYPYAGIGFSLQGVAKSRYDTNWVDLSSMKAFGFKARGKGLFSVAMGTKLAQFRYPPGENWGDFEVEFELDNAWQEFVFYVDELQPTPFSALAQEERQWYEAAGAVDQFSIVARSKLETAVEQEQYIELDAIRFYLLPYESLF